MPFVQRIIEPKYLSRSQKTIRSCSFIEDNCVVRTSAVLPTKNNDLVSVKKCPKSENVLEHEESSAATIAAESTTNRNDVQNSKTPADSNFPSIPNNSSPASSATSNDVNGSGITESGYYNNSSSMCVAAVTAATNSTSSGCTNNNSKARVRDEEHTTKMMMTTTMKMKNNHAFNSSNFNNNNNNINTKVITGFELESMCNITLSNALRQLGSLLVIANNMFSVLNCELQGITDRTNKIKQKIQLLEENVYSFDPKLVSVPEGDLSSIAQLKNFYDSSKIITKELFTKESRPHVVKMLYEEAAKGVTYNFDCSDIKNISSDQSEDTNNKSLDLICTPVFGKKNRQMKERIDADIEIRMPEGINNLRKWTSSEALGDVTVTPDCVNRIESSMIINSTLNTEDEVLNPQASYATSNDIVDHPIDSIVSIDVPLTHRLPSPEEQCKIIALKYPAELITVDTSGKRFERMCNLRRSINVCVPTTIGETNNLNSAVQTVTRRSRSKKTRGKRRNTIAGIDQKEIQDAMGFEESKRNVHNKSDSSCASTEFEKHKGSLTRLGSLKQWSCNRLKLIMRNNNEPERVQTFSSNQLPKKSIALEDPCKPISSTNMNVMVPSKRESPFYPKQGILPGCVKLRDSSVLSRYQEKEEPHSSSGNWSASSESGRTSIASEITLQAKSSATSNSSLNVSNYPPSSSSRRRFLNMSASDSVTTTTDGTATPDIPHSVRNDRFFDDETSSAYSCDTEGYYTSFHIDSGLKTLKEEQSVYTSFNTSIDAIFHGNSSSNSIENDYEVFGRGSTSTTTSSATTIITNLVQHSNLDDDTNTQMERSYSSSTIGSNSENANTIKRRTKPIESEISDVEGQAATLRIKEKTSISSNRIPSICLITPTTSDDERHVDPGPPQEQEEEIYDDPAGVYVTISKSDNIYSNCKKNQEEEKENNVEDLEYVSLKELPKLRMSPTNSDNKNFGVRIKRNPDGKIVYESDSIKRGNKSKMKASSFAPGTHVKETESALYSESNLNLKSSIAAGSAAAEDSSSTSASPSLSQKPIVVNMTSKIGSGMSLSKDNQNYWTLQNRKHTTYNSNLNRTKDDTFAESQSNLSPINPRIKGGLQTSTPTKDTSSSSQCSDRIGTPKTTLLDFKKLLLAKSTKTAPQKMSAVEMLKVNKANLAEPSPAQKSTMPILDLSGSPKIFASRRMLRQGQFGSPSKNFLPKQRSLAWRLNSPRTDIMSTAIPEAHSEEDRSNTSESSKSVSEDDLSLKGASLKTNIFLQAEENNFMKGEIKNPLLRTQIISQKYGYIPETQIVQKPASSENETIATNNSTNNDAHNQALETAL